LLASHQSVEEIRNYITADSLAYLSWDGLYSFLGDGARDGYCDACFTGKYPIEIPHDRSPHQLHLFEAADHQLNGPGVRQQGELSDSRR
jgi:amidophosphoribosyltransferase